MKVWINGQLINENQATISMFDRSYLYGEGIFETLMCYGGHPAFFSKHFDRLQRGCKKLKLKLPFSEKELEQAIQTLLKVNQLKEGVLRLTFSFVGASFGVDLSEKASPNLTLFCRPLSLDPELRKKGVKILPLDITFPDHAATAGIKSTSYLPQMLGRARASEVGAFDGIFKNGQGFWVEGTRTNLFVVADGTIITPPLSTGILAGITREVVIEIIQKEKIPFREAFISNLLLKTAEEIFLTGTTAEIMPVAEVIGVTTKTIEPNSLTHQLHQKYRSLL